MLGVLLIFNKKADRKEKIQHPQSFTILPFSDDDESLLLSIVGQTSIGIENTKLYESISKLFDGFIRASIMAIEARDPSTFGHSERVAKLTIALAKEVTYQTSGPLSHKSFSSRDLKELEYAALLHDFGKIGVRESVLTKAKKLHDFEIHAIKDRLDLWRQSIIIEYQQKIIELHTTNHKSLELDQKIQQLEEKHVKELQRVDHIFDLIILNNEPSILSKTELVEIESLLDLTFFRPNGEKDVILHSDQIQRLSIPRGSLSESERKEIELHVNITYQFLNQIPWTSEFENIPSIAYAHHEKLDGSGYPLGKVSHQIPYAAKLMTVTDVFDALVARDRPYKKAMPVKKALQVLQQEAQENKLDQELVALFQQKKLYQAIGQY
ncbi:MAG: HD domain-containing protein [Bdellovibrionales bacterium]|nr:HD domain-containing protein [Bdellovibrionales bacterium]